MLDQMKVDSIQELIDKTIPKEIRLKKGLELPPAMSEEQYLGHMRKMAEENDVFRSYIGMGYYGTITPPVVRRNVLENPGWYTADTPYQAEISQGRLEALLNFQTVVSDLTGLEIANASLLDEGTAVAEAVLMLFANRSRAQVKDEVMTFIVDTNIFPQTLSVLSTRAGALDIKLRLSDDLMKEDLSAVFGIFLQYPAGDGAVLDHKALMDKCHAVGVRSVVASDLMALTLLPSPGSWGADVVVGSSQRFGVPMGYGGPHAAFFAAKDEFKRTIPGRIIGVSIDRKGNPAFRMALQTREQHIRRDKATSNICTAQALLAVMASMYAVYHGPVGLKEIASEIHEHTRRLAAGLKEMGYSIEHEKYFDTLHVHLNDLQASERVRIAMETAGINLRYFEDGSVGLSLDETVTEADVKDLLNCFGEGIMKEVWPEKVPASTIPMRKADYLLHEVFNSKHSETMMMRYIKRLENKDLSLVHSMIPLGSCTMKLNAAAELEPITWPSFANIHPFVPISQTKGYRAILRDLARDLAHITGFAGVSLQPNSGAQGEYAGLMVIRAYHEDHGDTSRKVVLIPSSAHGTNPASAAMAGYSIVVVACDVKGNIDVSDLKKKAEQYSASLAGLMITYPSTHGVYESSVKEVTSIIISMVAWSIWMVLI